MKTIQEDKLIINNSNISDHRCFLPLPLIGEGWGRGEYFSFFVKTL